MRGGLPRALVVCVTALGSAAIASTSLAGCDVPEVVGVQGSGDPFSPVRLSRNDSVDVLFIVDDSASMAGKQARLRAALPALVAALPPDTSYHFGAITSDLGAGSLTTFGCTVGGDGAALSAVARRADSTRCPGTTDSRNFLDEDLLHGRTNRQPMQPLAQALDCMLSAGDTGCFVQQPLSAALQALRTSAGSHRPDTFLRDNALLVLLFLTDGDDCSLPPGSDLFDPDREMDYGPVSPFRCARFGLAYRTPARPIPTLPTGGPIPMPAPSSFGGTGVPGKLVDATVFRDAFTLPAASGGLKADPNDVVALLIAAPPEPFEIIGVRPGTERTDSPVDCAPVDGTTCIAAVKHACAASGDRALFGDPAVRLHAVLGTLSHRYSSPVCSVDQAPAVTDLANLIRSQQTGAGCLSARIINPGDPDCVVEDLITGHDGVARAQRISRCGTGVAQLPCWRLVPDARCAPIGAGGVGGDSQEFRIDIDRGGQGAPAGSVPTARCATLRN